jgi:protease I
MVNPKVLILTGDAAESLEVMYPYQRLREEGYEVKIAAPTKKKLHFVTHDFEPGFDTYTEKPGYSWDADLAFAHVNPADYAALVIPGGRAPEYIRNNLDCLRIMRALDASVYFLVKTESSVAKGGDGSALVYEARTSKSSKRNHC